MQTRTVLQLVAIVLLASMNSYFLAIAGAWLWMALLGVLFPVIGLVDWALVRKRESPKLADRLLGYLLAGLAAILALAGRPYLSETQPDPVEAGAESGAEEHI